MPEFIEVRFKGGRKDFFTWEAETTPTVGDAVVVEVERGRDLGRVAAVGETAERKCGVGCNGCGAGQPTTPTGKALRLASSDDTHLSNELRKAEEDVRRKVIEQAQSHKLNIKVSDAEWQWDRKKLTIYFTAETRVDFRALVRDLASLFRTRIELRQIGARDEAKRLDGVGRCGRQYCCSSWLPELRPVSLSLAKDQRLSLNPAQISGGCGRLLCCLRYEHEYYVTTRKRFPKEGRTLNTSQGTVKVESVDIFRERVLTRAQEGGTRWVGLEELKEAMATVEQPRGGPKEAQPPSALVIFDEGPSAVTTQQALEAVTPRRVRKRKRRRRKGKRGDDSTNTGE